MVYSHVRSHIRSRFRVKQTIVTILANDPLFIHAAEDGIVAARMEIEQYIKKDPFFQLTLEPYVPDNKYFEKVFKKSASEDMHVYRSDTFPIVADMINASAAAGVGPMSSVAGAIARSGVFEAKKRGASFCVVDNGGDIVLYNPPRPENSSLTVGIYAGSSPFSNYGFLLPPESDDLLCVCTSSGTVGPSISFGICDAAVIFSKDACLADAAATELGNKLKKSGRTEIKKALEEISKISGIEGAVLIQGENFGSVGRIPEIVPVRQSPDIITKA